MNERYCDACEICHQTKKHGYRCPDYDVWLCNGTDHEECNNCNCASCGAGGAKEN